MRKRVWKKTQVMFFVAWLMALTGGCRTTTPGPEAVPVSTPQEEGLPTVTRQGGVPTEEHRTAPTPAPEEGLSYEEHRGTFPPPPENLRAERIEGGVLFTWTPPAPVEIPHTYSDALAHYRIFRRTGEDLDYALLGTTEETRYLDQEVESGVTYHYIVTAVFDDGWEGDRPNEVSITVG